MPTAKVLVVDDNKILLLSLTKVLEINDFEVTGADNVSDALRHISTGTFDVLLTDLHMPGAGDGLTVVSAMRHANPARRHHAAQLLSRDGRRRPGHPAPDRRDPDQTDERPGRWLMPSNSASSPDRATTRMVESVATILERSVEMGMQDWYERVERDDILLAVPMVS